MRLISFLKDKVLGPYGWSVDEEGEGAFAIYRRRGGLFSSKEEAIAAIVTPGTVGVVSGYKDPEYSDLLLFDFPGPKT